jgi:sugar phosphate permease
MKVIAENLDIEKHINVSSKSATNFPPVTRAWLIWGCAALFYLYEYVLRVSPSVMTHELMRDFGVSSTALGVLASFYYYAYVPLQIPCGIIVDRLGVRRVVTFSALLCTVGSYIFAYSDNLIIAQAARFMIGAGSACAYLSCTKVGAEWFPPQKFAVIAGVTMMMGTFGGTFGGRPFAILVNTMGWRQSMVIASIVGCAVMTASWLIIRDHKKEGAFPNESLANSPKEAGLLDGLKIVAKNPQCWLIGIYGGLMYVPLSAFAELWGVPYLMKAYSINNEIASMASAMIFIGMALGSPLGAALSNKLESRLKIMSWSALLTLVMFSIVIYVPNLPLNLTFCLLFLAGLFCGGQILYFAAAKEITPTNFSGTTIGFTNALVMVSGIIFQPLLGMVLDLAWDGTIAADGTRIYSMNDYQQALTAVPFCLIIAWIVIKFVKETYNFKPTLSE